VQEQNERSGAIDTAAAAKPNLQRRDGESTGREEHARFALGAMLPPWYSWVEAESVRRFLPGYCRERPGFHRAEAVAPQSAEPNRHRNGALLAPCVFAACRYHVNIFR